MYGHGLKVIGKQFDQDGIILAGSAPTLRTIGAGIVSWRARLGWPQRRCSRRRQGAIRQKLLLDNAVSKRAAYPSPEPGMTAEPIMMRSVPSGAPGGILFSVGPLVRRG